MTDNENFCNINSFSSISGRPDNRFYCNVCGRNYLRKANLLRHVRHECIGIPPQFECNHCTSRYRRKEDLVRHIRNKHQNFMFNPNFEPSVFITESQNDYNSI